ncbi:MAG: SDR family oxidoreductase, partial [Methylococcaceae bacterium]
LELVQEFPDKINIHPLDVLDFMAINALSVALNGQSIDILINNAGMYGDSSKTAFGQMDYALWNQVLTVNTMAPIKMAEAFLPHICKGSRKLIVNLTSLMGSIADNQGGGSMMYRSSKAALNAALKSMAIDLKPQGIGIMILHPGWVKTDMGGSNAPTLPEASVAGLRQVIEAFRLPDSGRFLDFKGKELPW